MPGILSEGSHPHIHCVVAGGGLSLDRTRWISCRPNFFLPVRVLSRLFRRLFLKYLKLAFDAGKLQFFSALKTLRTRGAFLRHLAPAHKAKWTVYAKPPFGAPDQALNDPEPVLKSMARYTHRPAISDDRLLDIEDDKVAFRWKDYRDNNREKTMILPAEEFIRRFLLHGMKFHVGRSYASRR